MNRRIDRRQFLGVSAGTVASTWLAGCSSSNDGGTESDEPGEVEVRDVPAASFAFDYTVGQTLDDNGEPWADSDADGVLTVTHTSGDPIPADELFLDGTGITTAGDEQWYEQADASPSDPDGEVTAGNETSIETDSDCEVDVVWDPPGETNDAVFASFEGPDA